MTYYSKELVSKVRNIDLLTYLQMCEPDELVYINEKNYCTKTHDSLKISNGMWYWFSRGIGSNNALDYLIKVKGYTFKDSIKTLNNCLRENKLVNCNIIQKEKFTKLLLPEKDINDEKIISYLISRGIDEEIINDCISNNLIYQSKDKQNVVFVGYDKNNVVRYGFERGTNSSRFMHELSGSHKAFSFKMDSIINKNTLHIFESAIDLLSYATLIKLKNKSWKEENYLSLGGIYQPPNDKENGKMPIALMYYLNQNPTIDTIILHLDNDRAGRDSTQLFKNIIPSKFKIIDEPSEYGKDINDFLCFLKSMHINSNKESIKSFSDR